jgi:hypothetical protein
MRPVFCRRALLISLLAAACARNDVTPTELQPAGGSPVSAIPSGPYTPGQSYYGRNNYIEYVAGNTALIYSAPHGGSLTPSEIPDRTSSSCGESAVTSTDLNTVQLARAMQSRHFAKYGNYPHIVINHLHRKKLDANRDLLAGACGDPEAEIAWNEYHDFIGVAKNATLSASGKGWYMDMHGHGHEIQRLELGYLISGSALRLSDSQLNSNESYEDSSSFKTMSEASSLSFAALLRGSTSLGTLYANNNFPSVPASNDPYPESGEPYFSGGYNTARHSCGIEASGLGGTSSGNVCGVQIEANYTGVRDSDANRTRFGDVTAIVVEDFLRTNWGLNVGGSGGTSITLSTRAYKVKGSWSVDLSWSGATSSTVDVFRNGAKITTTANDGAFTDAIGKLSGTWTYQVCEAGTTTCSNTATVTTS